MKYKEIGSGISKHNLHELLQNSYKKSNDQSDNINNYHRDKKLSGDRIQVYHNPLINDTQVIHRGTSGFQDILTDFKLFLNPSSYRNTTRYKHAKEIQQRAENKYGHTNLTTIGHSLGSRLASDVGTNSKDIITYQKPFLPNEQYKPNEISLRTNNDVVSLLGVNKKHTKSFKSDSLNPFKAHNINQLYNLKQEYIGSGIKINNKELSNFEIIDICKKNNIPLKAVLPKDEVNNLKFGNYIINLENHNQSGSHWVTLMQRKDFVLYCDSFGLPMPEKLYIELAKKYKIIYFNQIDIQNINSILCGYYCISFLQFMKHTNKNTFLNKFTNYIKMFNSNTLLNDDILIKYLQ